MIIDVTKELDACKSAECSTEQREHLRTLISKFYNEENVILIYYGECYSQSRIEDLLDAVLADKTRRKQNQESSEELSDNTIFYSRNIRSGQSEKRI